MLDRGLICGGYVGKVAEGIEEKREVIDARDELPRLKEKGEATYQEYRDLRKAIASGPGACTDEEWKADTLHAAMKRPREEIVAVQMVQPRYKPRQQYHGFVWLFLRTAPDGHGKDD
jgi:hypothetical protein